MVTEPLPTETEHHRRPRPFRVVVGALVAFAACNLAAALYLQRYPVNPVDHRIADKWDLVDDPGGPVDWIIVGDSSCNQGIAPTVIEEQLGGRAVNLCTTGNLLAVEDAWALAAYLEEHPAPVGVIVGHVPDVWIRGARNLPTGLIRSTPGLADAAERHPPDVGVEISRLDSLVARWLPMWNRRSSLRALVRSPSSLFVSLESSVAGFFPDLDEDANPAEVRADAAGHLDSVADRSVEISDANAAALEAIDELAVAHDFDVHVVTSPMFEDLWNDPTYRAWVRDIVGDVAGLTSTLERVQMALCDPTPFPATLMNNADHVTITAALDYSGAVAAAVASGAECEPGDGGP